MNGGDTVALCRGGRWSSVVAPGGWGGNARCSAVATCDLRDYAALMDFSNGQEAYGILVGEASTPRGSDVSTGTTVRNNTVYYAKGTRGGDAIRVDTEGTSHVVTGNVVVSYSDQRENVFRCFNNGLPGAAYALLDRERLLAHRG